MRPGGRVWEKDRGGKPLGRISGLLLHTPLAQRSACVSIERSRTGRPKRRNPDRRRRITSADTIYNMHTILLSVDKNDRVSWSARFLYLIDCRARARFPVVTPRSRSYYALECLALLLYDAGWPAGPMTFGRL